MDIICTWANDWQLQLSIDKFKILDIGLCIASYQYYVACSKILAQPQCKDLGIIVTHDLSSQQHINEIVIKAHRRADCTLRCFMSTDNDLFVRAFVAYVRPILEHNSVVWSLSLQRDIETTEKIQRHFTKRLIGMR